MTSTVLLDTAPIEIKYLPESPADTEVETLSFKKSELEVDIISIDESPVSQLWSMLV